MDEFIFLLILIAVAGLLEKIFKAAQGDKASENTPPEGAESGAEGKVRTSPIPQDLQDLISEELGINLERRPRVEEETAGIAARPERQEDPYDPIRQRREEEKPRPPQPASERRPRARRSASEARARGVGPPARSGRPAVRPSRPASRTRPMPEPVEVTPAGPVISLEEQGMMERGPPVSLERARSPEDHERFHELYLERATKRRRRGGTRGARLPNRDEWSPVHRAIVWSEIIGPPKGLIE